HPDAALVLERKVEQFQHAINTALGLDLTAVAQPDGLPEPTGQFAMFAPPPVMGPVVPGQKVKVSGTLTNRGGVPISLGMTDLEADNGWEVFQIITETDGVKPPPPRWPATLAPAQVAHYDFEVTLAADAPISSRPYFSRTSLQESRYTQPDVEQFGKPSRDVPAEVVVHYQVAGVPVEIRRTV